MNKKFSKPRFRPRAPSKMSMRILKIGLPIISAALIALTLRLQSDIDAAPNVLLTYPDMYSHILAALTLLILGAMLFDIIERNK
ncbi:MAG: hypothetical protein IKT56_00905 [Clostridia bacterium]|nr:hypothetical protein [Clostridia bacterium]